MSLSASYSRDINQDFKLYTNLAYQDVWYKGTFPLFDPPPGSGRFLYYESDHAARFYGEARLSTTHWKDHQALVGIDFSAETVSRLFNHNQNAANTPILDSNDLDNRVGLYVQDDWNFAENWRVNAGLRYDHSELYGDHISPRFGLIWQTNPNLTVKALAGRAFRNPNRYESRYRTVETGDTSSIRNYQENLNLQAETINTYELVTEWHTSKELDISASIYHYHLANVISQTSVYVDDQQFQNLYNIETTGFEASARYRFWQQWKLDASLAIQDAKKNGDGRMDNSATWISRLAVDGPLWQDKLYAAWELQANGPTAQNWTGVNPAPYIRNSSIVVSNLTLTAA